MPPPVIACDESGSEGENLVTAAHTVFVHSSVHLEGPAAAEIIRTVRDLTGTQADEVKAKQLLYSTAAKARSYLLGHDGAGPLAGHAKVVLVDKNYFIVAKVIDLLVEELAHAFGIDLYSNYEARRMAHDLYRSGRRSLGSALWDRLLAAFNSLTRTTQRAGAKATVEEFFEVVDEARSASWKKDVSAVLALIWQARPFAEEFQGQLADGVDHMPTLDPLAAALPLTIRSWAEHFTVPVDLLHDQNAMLTQRRLQTMISHLEKPLPEFARIAPPLRIGAIEQADSKNDPRIQVADLLAGLARNIATNALSRAEYIDGATACQLRPFVVGESIWADNPSWRDLTGRSAVGAL